jgi:nucleoside-diphosphate-sugar epimerase
MLEHTRNPPAKPNRVVVMGARGFVGSAIANRLEADRTPVLRLSTKDIDLLDPKAGAHLAQRLNADDALVVVSALAPCRDVLGLVKNLRMMEQVCAALQSRPVDHVVYVSSDAVYADEANPVSERSTCQPSSLHGMMHAARELMLRQTVRAPLAVLRPSLLYGAADPHNGYGPNRFRRLAAEGKAIALFGEGEEMRDHVLIDDISALAYSMLYHRSQGVLNGATGRSVSFRRVAELIVAHFDKPVAKIGRAHV